MSLSAFLIIVLIVFLIGALPRWRHSANWTYFPSGAVGIVLVIVIVLLLAGRIQAEKRPKPHMKWEMLECSKHCAARFVAQQFRRVIMKTYMKTSFLLAAPLLLGGLAGCNGTPANGYIPGSVYQLEQLNKTQATGSPFTQALTNNYRVIAQEEKDEYDWFGQKIYAKKGLVAASGKAPPPEELSEWRVSDPVAANDLKTARGQLMNMLNGPAPSQYPDWSASAQTNFDCWLHEQHEGWEFDKIALCRRDFMKAMDQINAPPKIVQAPPPAPKAAPPPPPPPAPYLVFFDFDKTDLSPQARQVITSAAKAIADGKVVRIRVLGFTDSSGSNEYNNKLSVRRGDAVKQELVRNGVTPSNISVDGRGEGEQLMQTPDGVREPQNRRASIELVRP